MMKIETRKMEQRTDTVERLFGNNRTQPALRQSRDLVGARRPLKQNGACAALRSVNRSPGPAPSARVLVLYVRTGPGAMAKWMTRRVDNSQMVQLFSRAEPLVRISHRTRQIQVLTRSAPPFAALARPDEIYPPKADTWSQSVWEPTSRIYNSICIIKLRHLSLTDHWISLNIHKAITTGVYRLIHKDLKRGISRWGSLART